MAALTVISKSKVSRKKLAGIHYAVWMIEYYSRKTGIQGDEVNSNFNKHGVTKWLIENFESLHSVPSGYVLEDIKEMLNGNTNNTSPLISRKS